MDYPATTISLKELNPANLLPHIGSTPFWREHLSQADVAAGRRPSIHLAVFRDPYRDLIVAGRKSIESRFSRTRRAPFKAVLPGDVILLKELSGPITGIAHATHADSFSVSAAEVASIRQRYAAELCIEDDEFWSDKMGARYLTLIWLNHASDFGPLWCDKTDRRGWVVIDQHQMSLDI